MFSDVSPSSTKASKPQLSQPVWLSHHSLRLGSCSTDLEIGHHNGETGSPRSSRRTWEKRDGHSKPSMFLCQVNGPQLFPT
ncbi:unnamed protein product [Arctogadus glacialis]